MWSAWWLRGAGKYRPHCYEIHLQTVLKRLLCARLRSDRPGSDGQPSTTRRSLIPTLSHGEARDTQCPIVLLFLRELKTASSFFLFSHSTLLQETQNIRAMLVHNVKRAYEVVNSLPGFCCQPVEGGAFVFPRLYLPSKAIQKAKVTIPSHRIKYKPQN